MDDAKKSNSKKAKSKKGYGKDRKFDKPYVRDESSNDASWYADDPQLLRDATTFNFNNATGGFLPDDFTLKSNTGNTGITNLTVPGVCALRYTPTIGIAKTGDANAPINIAKLKLYTFVRHQNSGSANYDSPDLMQYVLAKTSIDSMWWQLARAYGLAFKYSQTNRYFPRALLIASGLDPDDIYENLADFRAFLNNTAVKLNSLFIPNVFGLYRRHVWMNSNVFLDSEGPKPSVYMYVQSLCWTYNDSTPGSVGDLTPESFVDMTRSSLLTLSALKTKFNTLLMGMLGSEDINIMSGDMMKAYGVENGVKLPFLSETFDVPFIYSEEVLNQIHNTTLVGEYFPNYVPKIVQDGTTGLLEFDPNINAYNFVSTGSGTYSYTHTYYFDAVNKTRFDLVNGDTSPERIIVASRNTATYASLSTNATGIASKVATCGSELFQGADIITNAYNASTTNPVDTQYYMNVINIHRWNSYLEPQTKASPGNTPVAHRIAALTKFDWFPYVHIDTLNYDNNAGEYFFDNHIDCCDMNVNTVLTTENVAKMHELALMTELNLTKR